jgi:superoxide dismutase, Cu-Zn family
MRSRYPVLAGLIGVLVLPGCTPTTVALQPSRSMVRNVEVNAMFTKELGTAVTYDRRLVKAGSHAAVSSRSGGGITTVTLVVRGFEPERWYGAHVHSDPCGEKGAGAGPHFQNVVDPVQPSVDPRFANPQNEIWLDLRTDKTGAGTGETTVAWQIPPHRRPKSVVIHAKPTATGPGVAGTAGVSTACVTVEF